MHHSTHHGIIGGLVQTIPSGLYLDSASDSAATQLTLEFWMKADVQCEASSALVDLCTLVNNSTSRVLCLCNPGNLRISMANNKYWDTGINLLDGRWHHIALVIKIGDPMRVYVDTVERWETNNAFTGSLCAANTQLQLFLGRGTHGEKLFRGSIGHARLWSVARLEADILRLARRTLDSSTQDDLRACFEDRFDAVASEIQDSVKSERRCRVNGQGVSWNNAEPFGTFVDTAPPVTNMTGHLRLDVAQRQRITGEKIRLPSTATGLTMMMWVKGSDKSSEDAVLFRLEADGFGMELHNPYALAVRMWGTETRTIEPVEIHSVARSRWHHVALTCSKERVELFVDGQSVVVEDFETGLPVGARMTWYVGGRELQTSDKNFHLSASVSDMRLYSSVRTKDQIVDEDAAYRPADIPPEMLVYWPLTKPPVKGKISDASRNKHTGELINSPAWVRDGVFGRLTSQPVLPAPARGSQSAVAGSFMVHRAAAVADDALDAMLLGAVPGAPPIAESHVAQALRDAKATGYFDKQVFPNIYGLFTEDDHDGAKAAIAELKEQVFLDHWKADRRLSLKDHGGDRWSYEFVPVPRRGFRPMLFLVENYGISAFFAELGQGQVVRTFSLTPGESTFASIKSYKELEVTREKASSVVDSSSTQSTEAFEDTLAGERGDKTAAELSLDFNATAAAKARWGFGNASVSGGLGAKGSAERQSFLQQTSNALKKHAAEASAARQVEVDTSFSVQAKQGRETAITREFKNINNSRTMNIVFRQLTQSIKVIQHLMDVKVGYVDPEPGSFRVVPLVQLDELLDEVLRDPDASKLDFKRKIIEEVLRIPEAQPASSNKKLLQSRNKNTGATQEVDPNDEVQGDCLYSLISGLSADVTLSSNPANSVRVDGLEMTSQVLVMRTDNVIADVEIGMGVGLDDYAKGLQTETVRREKTNTDSIAVENRRTEQALDILAAAREAGYKPEQLAQLYRELFPVPPANNVNAALYQGLAPTKIDPVQQR